MFRGTSAIPPSEREGGERGREQNVSNEKMRWEMGLKKGRRGMEGGREGVREKGDSPHAGKWGSICDEGRGARGTGREGDVGSGVKSPKKGAQRARSPQPGRQIRWATGSGFIRPHILCHPEISLCLQVASSALFLQGPPSPYLTSTGFGCIVQRGSAISYGVRQVRAAPCTPTLSVTCSMA